MIIACDQEFFVYGDGAFRSFNYTPDDSNIFRFS